MSKLSVRNGIVFSGSCGSAQASQLGVAVRIGPKGAQACFRLILSHLTRSE